MKWLSRYWIKPANRHLSVCFLFSALKKQRETYAQSALAWLMKSIFSIHPKTISVPIKERLAVPVISAGARYAKSCTDVTGYKSHKPFIAASHLLSPLPYTFARHNGFVKGPFLSTGVKYRPSFIFQSVSFKISQQRTLFSD